MQRQSGGGPNDPGNMIFFIVIMVIILFNVKPVDAYQKGSNDIATTIPDKAHLYLDQLDLEILNYFPDMPMPPYFGALIEHESCITLRHSRCWSPTSELKTKREQGIGFGQLTRAYNSKGKIRFDTIGKLRARYDHLKDLRWSTVRDRPDLQLRAIVTLYKQIYVQLPEHISVMNRIMFSDAAYNGGYRGMYRDRQLCKLKKGCNPIIWLNNVEDTCSKSTKPLYAGRSACDINRHHVRDVVSRRTPKYIYYWLSNDWLWWNP